MFWDVDSGPNLVWFREEKKLKHNKGTVEFIREIVVNNQKELI